MKDVAETLGPSLGCGRAALSMSVVEPVLFLPKAMIWPLVVPKNANEPSAPAVSLRFCQPLACDPRGP